MKNDFLLKNGVKNVFIKGSTGGILHKMVIMINNSLVELNLLHTDDPEDILNKYLRDIIHTSRKLKLEKLNENRENNKY